MKPNRRRFLSLLGVGTAAGPLAAKAAADAEVANLMNIRALGALGGISGSLPMGSPAEGSNISYGQRVIGASDYIKIFGLPKEVEEAYRRDAYWLSGIDCDIACKKSWSMSVKVMTQRQRNYERNIEHIHKAGWRQKSLDVLKATMGFDWPW
jgi:hypothetical protein